MNKGRSILYIAIPVCIGLFCLLGWNAVRLYQFEQKHVQDAVDMCVKNAADTIQNYNGSQESTYAAMLSDQDYDRKVAFAAGFTHNMGKIMIPLEDVPPPVDTSPAKKTDAQPKVVTLNAQYFRQHNIKYSAARMMTVHHFDSVFKKLLTRNSTIVPYTIVKIVHYDTAGKDSIMSQPFILEFAKPVIYAVHYHIPSTLVIKNMLPYLSSAMLICLLIPIATIYLYRSYRLQAQMAGFRESLLGNITHELKTPLSSLQIIIESAAAGTQHQKEVTIPSQHIAFAASELKRMKLLVERILSFSKLNQQQLVLSQQQVAVSSVVNDTLVMMEMKIGQSGTEVQVHQYNDFNILCDPLLLTNAIAALIDNAIKYTANKPAIELTIQQQGTYCEIAVKDNGTGIPPEYRKKIFDAFFRIPTGNVQDTTGHGLGLSFVQQVAELHGGSISFTSNTTGTTFTLKIPVS